MKTKIFNLLISILYLLTLASCNGVFPKNKNTITIINTLTNEQTLIKLDKDYFKIEDLPCFEETSNYFLGYSLNIDDNYYLNSDTVYKITKNLKVYANFGIKKDSFKIDSIGYLFINTNKNISSKEDYVDATVQIVDNNYTLLETPVHIRLRGNSSLEAPKKSYKLKFNNKVDIFDFGSDKEWALIANYYDPSLFRNYYAYNLGKVMGLEYNVDCKFVNVYLNEQNQGLYLFTETVKTSSNRVDIENSYNPDSYEIPFLLELDFKLKENNPNYVEDLLDKEFFFLDNRKYNGKMYQFATKYPKSYTKEHITSKQYKFIMDYMNAVYESVRNQNYDQYIDVDSFINYFIIQELFLNIDQDYSSVFMYKPYGEKLHMGPIWDFDISTGNCNYAGIYDPYRQMKDVNGGNYLFVTLMKDKNFKNKFLSRLKELDTNYTISTMLDSFEHNYQLIKKFAEADNKIWNNLNKDAWPRPKWLLNLTYKQQVDYLNNYLKEHYYWMIKNM